ALDCADKLPASDARVETVRKAAEQRLLALVNDVRAPLSADDRQDIWRLVWDIRETRGDVEGAHEAARHRLAIAQEAAEKAPHPQAACTFDWARAESLLFLDRGPDAVKMLEKSEAALPDDYNPPSRLARVHLGMKAYGEALAAVDRALPKAYGPRKNGIYMLKADILEKQGRKDEARRVVEEDISYLQKLPDGEPKLVAAARQRLTSLRWGQTQTPSCSSTVRPAAKSGGWQMGATQVGGTGSDVMYCVKGDGQSDAVRQM